MNTETFFTTRRNIVLIAALCAFFWGSAYPSIKIGYEIFHISSNDIPTKLIFAGYRFSLSGIMVLLISTIKEKALKLPYKTDFSKILILGLFLTTAQYIFFYIGLSHTTGVNGAILNGTGTFYSVILAHFIYKDDYLNMRKTLGCFLGFIGIVIVNFSSDFRFAFNFFGDGFIIIAALISSSANIYSKFLSRSIDILILTGFQLLFGGILLVVLGYLTGGSLTGFTLKSTSLLIYMGFLSAAAFSLWTYLLKYNKVGEISFYNFLIPIFGAILSSLFLGERFLNTKNILALFFVCIGIYIVNKDDGKIYNWKIVKLKRTK
ncbi:drug/metabolite transporter (DMT)-like permease [Alkalibaculum bacchi]|uniref:Drug/metabolite transporter (DMT)-like permease n=1 Tax=Alkalibaculum bacchi TaxID=645887 RepID=A0A366IB56_9FIRM|nr:DMT family transporter [Alkalibaculum bacchi]RBP66670.1 drug/metabolite transporter (DMT)-like permease [Alkalibaculum bacchi]